MSDNLTLTKTDIAALRKADDLVIHLNAALPTGKVSAIKRKRLYDPDPFAQDVYHTVTATVGLEGSRGHKELAEGRVKAFAMIGLYHNQHTTASALLKQLKVGDEVWFSFWPDGHSNGYIAAAGLHADLLMMRVIRKGKVIGRWELTSSVTPDNSARMVTGVPNSASYNEAAKRINKRVA